MPQSVAQLRRELQAAHKELEDFKARVRDKAVEISAEQGWCEAGRNEVLRELGIAPPSKPRIRFWLQRTYVVTADLTGSFEDYTSGPAEFIESSLPAWKQDDGPALDDDWDNVEVEDFDDKVVTVEVVEEGE